MIVLTWWPHAADLFLLLWCVMAVAHKTFTSVCSASTRWDLSSSSNLCSGGLKRHLRGWLLHQKETMNLVVLLIESVTWQVLSMPPASPWTQLDALCIPFGLIVNSIMSYTPLNTSRSDACLSSLILQCRGCRGWWWHSIMDLWGYFVFHFLVCSSWAVRCSVSLATSGVFLLLASSSFYSWIVLL